MNTRRTEKAWLLAAMAAPLAQTAARCSWNTVAVTALVCGILCRGVEAYCREVPRWVETLSWAWGILLLGMTMDWAGACWHGKWIPEILLLLALWTTVTGREKLAGAALIWPMGLLLGLTLLAGLGELEKTNLKPGSILPLPALVAVLLLPARKGRNGGAVLAILFSVVTQGILGVTTAAEASSPFYELGRSLNLPGTSERFESLIAMGLTLGYFTTAGYLLSKGGKTEKGWPVAGAAAAAGIRLTDLRIPQEWLAAGTVFFWAFLPLVSQLKIIYRKTKIGVDK